MKRLNIHTLSFEIYQAGETSRFPAFQLLIDEKLEIGT
jgi:hypothetical protein